MKTPKTYRLSPMTLLQLEQLKKKNPNMTETEIVETAIWELHTKWGNENDKGKSD